MMTINVRRRVESIYDELTKSEKKNSRLCFK